MPKAASKVSIVVTNMNLASGEMVERRRAAWREMLNSLAALVAPAATKKSISGKN